jgi:MerR family gold-responsive transcriptional activator of gol and ges genes
MNIGQAAKASGVSAKMIRYYESIGLIPAAGRTGAGYRTYGATEVQTLRFIRRARDLGFPVERIADLLALWTDRSRHSADVKRLAQGQIDGLRRRIAEMQDMVDTLAHLADCCAGDDRPDCPILRDLETPHPPALRDARPFRLP